MSLKRYGGRHQSVLNLDCEKIDRENNTLQEVKSKSIEDEAKKTYAQKLNTKTDTNTVKVQPMNIHKNISSLKSAEVQEYIHPVSAGKTIFLQKKCTAKFLVLMTIDCLAYLIICHTGN